ncbi:lipopolysaccharide assembly protein LapA domain-containing protein [Thalassotalea agarivorans]|nr:LapA family protein [Thalassotalea agarivorans]
MFVLLLIAIVFGSQNDQIITLNYIIARADMPVAMAVSIFTSIGFVLGLLVALLWKFVRLVRRKRALADKKASL